MAAGDRIANQQTLRGVLARKHARLVLFTVLLAAVSLTISGIAMLRGQAATNVELAAKTIGYSVEPALYFGDSDAAQRTLEQFANIESIRKVEVIDAFGENFAEWERVGQDRPGIAVDLASMLFRSTPVESTVIADNKPIGVVRVHASVSTILKYAMAGFIIGIVCLGLSLVATQILARRLEKGMIEPLEQVGAIAKNVRENRDFGLRVTPSGLAEVDQLGRDLNGLLAEMQDWHNGVLSDQSELAHRADHDTLTGLGNRDKFDRSIRDLVADADSNNGRFAILFIDCDGFKNVNDLHGHYVGDMTLCDIAERIWRSAGFKDNAFRLGGDEFAVFLPDIQDADEVESVREKVQEAMNEPFILAMHKSTSLTVSIGSVVFPDDGHDPFELLREADRRMYRVKRAGK